MTDSMSVPVTRGELREELERFATKVDLELWGGALEARMEAKLAARLDGLSKELAAHVQVILETVRRDNRVLDDKYADLPQRVTVLEAKVAAPKRRRR